MLYQLSYSRPAERDDRSREATFRKGLSWRAARLRSEALQVCVGRDLERIQLQILPKSLRALQRHVVERHTAEVVVSTESVEDADDSGRLAEPCLVAVAWTREAPAVQASSIIPRI